MSSGCAADGCKRPHSSKGWCKVHAERIRRNGTPEVGTIPIKVIPMADRLWSKVDKSAGPDACWPFTGKLSQTGYGRIRIGGSGTPTIGVHRGAFLLANPGIAPPEAVDHICHDPQACRGGDSCPHRRCCNPAHLVGSTLSENSAADRQWTRAQLTHCSNGHEYTEANTYRWRGDGPRRCRRCQAEAAARQKAGAA
jgi:hypothetical protein